ncbi:unnamed protein product, partial [Ectocarpus sp. 8 AP-2014]
MSGKSLPDAIAREIGTIKFVWRDCVKIGKEFSGNCQKYATVSSYKQANKTDVMATGGAGTGAGEGMRLSSTTRAGKVFKLDEARSCVMDRYRYVGEPWSATLRYRTKSFLQCIGVMPFMSPEEVAELERMRIARRKKRCTLQEEAAARGAFGPPPVPVSLADEPPLVATEGGEGQG